MKNLFRIRSDVPVENLLIQAGYSLVGNQNYIKFLKEHVGKVFAFSREEDCTPYIYPLRRIYAKDNNKYHGRGIFTNMLEVPDKIPKVVLKLRVIHNGTITEET